MAYETLETGKRSGAGCGVLHSLVNVTATSTASSTGSYKAFELNHNYSNFALQVVVDTTEVTNVVLEGSLDGTNWDTIPGSTWAITQQSNGNIIYVNDVPAGYVRANYVTKNSTKPLNAYIAPK